MKNHESYIGGTTGGVPESIFQPGLNKQLVYGGSGQTRLTCTTQPNSLEIEDYHEPKFHFLTYIETYSLITLSTNNTGWLRNPTKKHPDIYPFRLLKRSIAYFAEQGFQIQGISAYWEGIGRLADNYNQYWNFLQSLGKTDFTPTDRIQAAQSTKTADMARRLGFSIVEDPQHIQSPDNTSVVTTIFRRD